MTLQVLTALRTETRAVTSALPGAHVTRCGMGAMPAAARATEVLAGRRGPVAILGFCGALDAGLRPGDAVVATEVRGPDGTFACPSAPLVAAALHRRGHTAALGPLRSLDHVAGVGERRRLRDGGALAVDMESAALLAACAGRPVVVVRTVVDDLDHSLWSLGTPIRALRAAAGLRAVARAVGDWAAACGDHQVALASPRSFCAGVERAIETVESALEASGPPVYVRKQIVHNRHVVAGLERRGAVFVDEVSDVPEGATVVFSAHGVSPAVRQQASERSLRVIDATCPLVSKVHAEARRFAAQGRTILLIGHDGHEEVEGTPGEAPGAIRVVERAEDVAGLEVGPAAYLTQTTLALDETAEVVEALAERFPDLAGPPSEDICYATQNRQDALRAVASGCDVMLVVGSTNSSNSRRLVEVSERLGTPAHLIDDEAGIDPEWLAGRRSIGLTAGASAPERLVESVIDTLRGLGPLEVTEHVASTESVRFHLPNTLKEMS